MDEIKEKKRVKIEKGEYYVYVYLDPRRPGKYAYGDYKFLHEPIYVGKGKRKRAYYFEDRNWMLREKLLEIGKPLIILLVKGRTESNALFLEKTLISLIGKGFDKKGPLCNLSNGGKGSSGYKLSSDTIKKMCLAQKNHKMTEETKQKIRDSWANKSILEKEKIKKKISEVVKGKKRIRNKPVWNKGMSTGKPAWNKGLATPTDTVLKMSESKKRYWETQRINNTLARKPHSDETKRKIGEASKKAWIKQREIIAAKTLEIQPLLE